MNMLENKLLLIIKLSSFYFSLTCMKDLAVNALQQDRIYGMIPGDLYIGALFSIHDQPVGSQMENSDEEQCGNIREQYGIQRVEAAIQTINAINANKALLPNIKLGIYIRDSCWHAPVALKETLQFLPGLSRDTNMSRHGTTIGVIGPGSSDVTIQVQNLLQLFDIPQIGYSATSKDLSDKSRYGYFFRVVPSDNFQARVIVDIILKNNWNYVSAVHTEGNYGAKGMKAFLKLSENSGICTAAELQVPQYADSSDEVFNKTILELYEHTRARVVVCFCEGRTVRGLLRAIHQNNLTGYFHIIGSDGWADRTDVIQGLESAAIGGTSIKIHTTRVKSFDKEYFSLKPQNSVRNPWLKEFWSWRFNCTLEKNKNLRICSGKEDLKTGYKQDTKLAFVAKAIYTLAHGLHRMQESLCGNKEFGYCSKMQPFNGRLYKEYLKNVSFKFEDEIVLFDKNGDPPGKYDIVNFQSNDNVTDYVTIGTWYNGTLNLTRSEKYPPQNTIFGAFQSICSDPCQLGEAKHMQDGKTCCWSCIKCRDQEFLYNESTCRACMKGWWPNENKTGCNKITIESTDMTSPLSIVVIILANTGLILTGLTAIIYIKNNNTLVVKSSSRELSYTILVGCSFTFLTVFPIIHTPTVYSCVLARILPGLSIACIYGALATKTNRMARMFLREKGSFASRPKFMGSGAQLLIASVLIFIEAVVVIISIEIIPPTPLLYYPSPTRVKLVCQNNWKGMLIPFGFDFILLIICTCYAVKTRNVPENFNEAKFIGFSCYTICVIWVSYVPIWFGSEIQEIATCVCLSLTGFVTLTLQFLPKLYIIIFRPHKKNDRSFFTTCKGIRCHVGGKGVSSLVDTTSRMNSAVYPTQSSSHNSSRKSGEYLLEPWALGNNKGGSLAVKRPSEGRVMLTANHQIQQNNLQSQLTSKICSLRSKVTQTDEQKNLCSLCNNKEEAISPKVLDIVSRQPYIKPFKQKDNNQGRNGLQVKHQPIFISQDNNIIISKEEAKKVSNNLSISEDNNTKVPENPGKVKVLNDPNETCDLKEKSSRITDPNNKKFLPSTINDKNINAKKIIININTPDIWC